MRWVALFFKTGLERLVKPQWPFHRETAIETLRSLLMGCFGALNARLARLAEDEDVTERCDEPGPFSSVIS
jgi:hypothetical protein